jgi:hypothetical protein
VPGPGMTNLRPRIAGAGFDRPGQHLIAWRQRNLSTQDQDARGALWSTLQSGGGVTILDTGCGGPGAEPLLLTSSVPALGTSCSVTLLNFNAPLLGFGAPSVLPPCAGTSCSFGLGATTYLTAPSTTFTFQIGTSPTLLGTQLALQGLDYLPPANATEVCPSTGSTSFTTSDTIVFTVQ